MGGVGVTIILLSSRHVNPNYYIEVKHGRTYLMQLRLDKCGLVVAENRFNKIVAKWKQLADEKDCYSKGGSYD